MKTETITIMIADENKTFKRVSTNEILGDKLTLGAMDSVFNYIEVEKEETKELINE